MIGRNLVQAGQALRRNFSTSARRLHDYEYEGVIGGNLPFSIENPWTLAAKMAIFCGTAFTLPFTIVRHQLLLKRAN